MRRAGEPAVRLQHAGEHDADAVEHDLRREDEQEAGGEGHLGVVAAAEQQPRDRLGEQRDRDGERREDQQRPAEQRRRRPAHLLAVADGDARRRASGTTRLASAPPATTSKTMFGTVFAAR